MAEISDSLRLLFETSLEDDGDRYVVPVPKPLVDDGALSAGETYRVALLTAAVDGIDAADGETDVTSKNAANASAASSESSRSSSAGSSRSASSDRRVQEPPVDEGDIRSVTIDTLGDQGDGIAKVERGFILIVPGTEPGDQLNVRVTDVKETVAFAEPLDDSA